MPLVLPMFFTWRPQLINRDDKLTLIGSYNTNLHGKYFILIASLAVRVYKCGCRNIVNLKLKATFAKMYFCVYVTLGLFKIKCLEINFKQSDMHV